MRKIKSIISSTALTRELSDKDNTNFVICGGGWNSITVNFVTRIAQRYKTIEISTVTDSHINPLSGSPADDKVLLKGDIPWFKVILAPPLLAYCFLHEVDIILLFGKHYNVSDRTIQVE